MTATFALKEDFRGQGDEHGDGGMSDSGPVFAGPRGLATPPNDPKYYLNLLEFEFEFEFELIRSFCPPATLAALGPI